MKFASTRLIAADIKGMVAFYEMVTGLYCCSLARPGLHRNCHSGCDACDRQCGNRRPMEGGQRRASANRSAYIEFQVEDIDADYERLKDKVQLVRKPR